MRKRKELTKRIPNPAKPNKNVLTLNYCFKIQINVNERKRNSKIKTNSKYFFLVC